MVQGLAECALTRGTSVMTSNVPHPLDVARPVLARHGAELQTRASTRSAEQRPSLWLAVTQTAVHRIARHLITWRMVSSSRLRSATEFDHCVMSHGPTTTYIMAGLYSPKRFLPALNYTSRDTESSYSSTDELAVLYRGRDYR